MAGVGNREGDRIELLLVCSSGGHLLQLVELRGAWASRSRVWITHDSSDARSLLAREEVVFAHAPTHRNVPNLLRNALLAWRLLRRLRPRVVVTTGAGVAVPFAWLGRLLGARVVFVESLTRIDGPSLTLRLVRPVVDRAYVQWPEAARGRKLHYAGTLVPL